MNDEKTLDGGTSQRTPATARDRILLACHGLTWMASQLETVASHTAHMALVDDPVLADAAAERRAFLDRIADRLTSALNDMGDYCNGVDIVTDEDERVLGPVFDLLNEQAPEPGPEAPPFDALWGAGAGHEPDRTSLDLIEEMRDGWRD